MVSAGGSSYAGDLLVVDPAGPDRARPLRYTATGIEGSAVVVTPRGEWYYHRLGVLYRQAHPELGDALAPPTP